jgi:hypothetical protein
VKVRIGDLVTGGRIRARRLVIQQKTERTVQFELEPARTSILDWLERRQGARTILLFPAALSQRTTSARDNMRGWSTSW